eukprot:2158281-Rhodomonas_salina.1
MLLAPARFAIRPHCAPFRAFASSRTPNAASSACSQAAPVSSTAFLLIAPCRPVSPHLSASSLARDHLFTMFRRQTTSCKRVCRMRGKATNVKLRTSCRVVGVVEALHLDWCDVNRLRLSAKMPLFPVRGVRTGLRTASA